MATNQDVIDVDKSYDPASGLTLDQHRQQAFATLQQSGFGGRTPTSQPAADPAPATPATAEE
jgi:hypothetical protein